MRIYVFLFAACAAATFLFGAFAEKEQPPPSADQADIVFEHAFIEIKTTKEWHLQLGARSLAGTRLVPSLFLLGGLPYIQGVKYTPWS